MDYIKKLHEIQDWFEVNTIHSFSFKLEIHDNEITFEYHIGLAWDNIGTYKNCFNACDRKTNLEGIEKKIKSINYEQYKS